MLTVSIITIGDELLIGQVIDTNSAWMAQQLNKAGIQVIRRVAVGDIEKEIWAALEEEAVHSDVVLLTGGLGPTSDDITKPLLCKFFKGKMVVNEEVLKNVKDLYQNVFNKIPTPDNFRQAEVPDVCTVIPNKRGTAPGMWFEKDGKIFISMPGVPFEMQGMMTNYVIGKLSEKFTLPFIVHRTLLTSGVGESIISGMLTDFEDQLPKEIRLAYLPSYNMVRLRLTSTGQNKELLEKAVELHFNTMKKIISDFIVTDEDENISQVLGKLLLQKGKTVGTAESCTGGYLAHLITINAGSSNYYKGTIVSYANEIKTSLLKVKEDTLSNNGAVSESTVKEMLIGAIKSLKTDYGIAVSGIMGPDGGSEDKPVGTVWLAVGSTKKIETKKIQLRFDRNKNIELTAIFAIDFLRKHILSENGV